VGPSCYRHRLPGRGSRSRFFGGRFFSRSRFFGRLFFSSGRFCLGLLLNRLGYLSGAASHNGGSGRHRSPT
jgi:hypothetical protein